MPTKIEELLRKKIRLLEDTPSIFEKAVTAEQKKIFQALIIRLGELDTVGGEFVASLDNLAKLDDITKELKKILHKGEYFQIVREFAKSFDESAALTDAYLKKMIEGFEVSAVATEILKRNKRAAIEQLIGSPLDNQFIRPIGALLENAIAAGSSWVETIKAVREFIEGEGTKKHGKLATYTKQIVSDTLAITDRTYTQTSIQGLGMDWFVYAGGLLKDSRCFCIERNGKYFHRKEIEAWGRGEVTAGNVENCGYPWAGMIPQTNESTIFILAGGYRCQHTIMPVSVAIVPKDVIMRNIRNGNFVPSEFEKKELGLVA